MRVASITRAVRCLVPQATSSIGAVRHLNLHEYQSKDLMEKFGVKVQKGKMAESSQGAYDVAKWVKDASTCRQRGCGVWRAPPRRALHCAQTPPLN